MNLGCDTRIVSGLRPKRLKQSCGVAAPVSLKRHAAICACPFDRFCELILNWNMCNGRLISDFTTIPERFDDFSMYVKAWEPLLVEEIKASVLSSLLNQKQSKGTVNVAQIEESGMINCITLTCAFSAEPVDTKDRKDGPQIMDLILISNGSLTMIDIVNGKNCDVSIMLAIVCSYSRMDGTKCVQIKALQSAWQKMLETRTDSKIPTNSASNSIGLLAAGTNSTLKKRSKESCAATFNFVTLDTLTSSWREFLALHDCCNTSPLLDHLLSPSKCASGDGGKDAPGQGIPGLSEQLQTAMSLTYNPSQLNAIRLSSASTGFTLIQGPPGTGKTTTVIGILNAIHIREYNRYYEKMLAALLGEDGQRCRRADTVTPWLNLVSKVAKSKPHILVAAPSNVAVDNIVQRIIEKGFLDGNCGKYFPHIIRIGGGKSARVKIVALEDIVDQELLVSLNERDCKIASDTLTSEINRLVREASMLLTAIVNMQMAFSAHPLPPGWELRVTVATSQPYWVDHVNRTTSNTPPSPVGLKIFKVEKNEDGTSTRAPVTSGDYTFQTLPEYLIYSHQITQVLDQLDRCNIQSTRCRARMRPHEFGGPAAARQAIESSVVDEAHIVFTTLNSAGHACLEATEFCVTVIDEAAQCTEPSALIPLRRGCKQCIMVGDPQQLPATIFSNAVKNSGYDTSLFERLLFGDVPVTMLDVQYRMCPAISNFPSHTFYDGKLKDGENVMTANYGPSFLMSMQDQVSRLRSSPVLLTATKPTALLSPLMFFDLLTSRDMQGSRVNSVAKCTTASESSKGMTESSSSVTVSSSVGQPSRSNPEEVKFCVTLMKTLIAEARKAGTDLGSVAVITPYSEQLSALRKAFAAERWISARHSHSLVHESSSSDSLSALQQLGNSESAVAKSCADFESEAMGFSTTSNQTNICRTAVFSSATSNNITSSALDVELNTVDGFQGREKDIVIISTVRANDLGSIGFLSDTRRMNVALTRSKHGLFIVGCGDTLRDNMHWGSLIAHCQEQDLVIVADHAQVNIISLITDKLSKLLRACDVARAPVLTIPTHQYELEEGEC